jgi:hypothetical protein
MKMRVLTALKDYQDGLTVKEMRSICQIRPITGGLPKALRQMKEDGLVKRIVKNVEGKDAVIYVITKGGMKAQATKSVDKSSLAGRNINKDQDHSKQHAKSAAGKARSTLFPCPDCGNQISTKAETCPRCGCLVDSIEILPGRSLP